jgi:two-component system, cell cycle response regulator DivK
MEITLHGKRVFYIEDDMMNRLIVQTILEAQGAIISFDSWGYVEVSVPQLNAFRPDVILLDLMFPNRASGYDIYDSLRRLPSLSKIPVIAISASDPAIEIPRARAKGFAGFISKPISLHRLPEQIITVLQGGNIWHSG